MGCGSTLTFQWNEPIGGWSVSELLYKAGSLAVKGFANMWYAENEEWLVQYIPASWLLGLPDSITSDNNALLQYFWVGHCG